MTGWCELRQILGNFAKIFGSDESFCFAIVQDITRLLGGQVTIDGGEIEPGPKCCPHHFEEAQVVLHENGHMISRTKTLLPHQLSELVGAIVQVFIRNDVTGDCVNSCSLVRKFDAPFTWIHDYLLV